MPHNPRRGSTSSEIPHPPDFLVTSIITQSPDLTPEEASRVARDGYGIAATAEALPGERDQNFRLESENGNAFVLKIANAREDRSFLEAQNQVMARLRERKVAYCPQLISTRSEADFFEIDANGSTYAGRLITWMPGERIVQTQKI